jgi:hypothetical protein
LPLEDLMKVTVVRSLTIAGLFAGAPFLLGANGSGCQAPPLVSDAGADATPPACVSTENGPCGAFIAQPCTCAAGLECVGQTMSGAGTCLPPKDAGAEDAAIDDAAPDALGSAVDASPPDSSGCLSASDCPVNSGAACASVCADGTNPCVNACVAGACVERGCPDSGGAGDGATCVQTGICPPGDSFDTWLCKCVPTPDAAGPCYQSGICVPGNVFDHALCVCVHQGG